MIHFRCPKCDDYLTVPESLAGATETCPNCGNVAIVPKPEGGPPLVAPTPPAAVTQYRPDAPGATSALVCGIIAVICVASCIFGLLADIAGICMLSSILGLLVGVFAVHDAKKARKRLAESPESWGGAGMASAGNVLGQIAIVFSVPVLVGVLIVVLTGILRFC